MLRMRFYMQPAMVPSCHVSLHEQLPAAVAQACNEGSVPMPADPGFLNVQPRFGAAFANMYLYNRSQAAAQLGKPWILEEVGPVRFALECQGVRVEDPVPEASKEPSRQKYMASFRWHLMKSNI